MVSASTDALSQTASHSVRVAEPVRQRGGGQGGDPHGHAAPARHRGERGGALHGRADEGEVVHRPGVQSRRGRRLPGGGSRNRHAFSVLLKPAIIKYFAEKAFSAYLRSEVHWGQRTAPTGIGIRQ